MQNQENITIASPVAPPFPGGVVYLQATPAPSTLTVFDRYLHKVSVGLGTTQIVLGSLCIVFNAIALGVGTYYYGGASFVGHGFWCGVLFIITGAFGISAGMIKTRCKIIAFMVLSIISASLTSILLALGILGAILYASEYDRYCDYYDYGYSYYYEHYYRPPCYYNNGYRVAAGMEGSIAVCGFIILILSIWGSTLACKVKACCCCQTVHPQQMTIPINYSPNNPQGAVMSGMPFQQGMVAMTGPPSYQASFIPSNIVPDTQTARVEMMNQGAELAKA